MVTTKLQSMATGSKHSFYFQSANQVPDSADIPSGETTLHQDHVYSLQVGIRIITEIKKSNHPQMTCGDNKVGKHGYWF